MEKAILKTLIYSDIFDYPLKAWEIHKWLIEKKSSLQQTEKAISHLVQSAKCKVQKQYYLLPKRQKIVATRLKREAQSKKYLRQAKIVSQFFKVIPWVKLVGISGSLAMGNAGKKDDIDLFVITANNKLWLSRFFLLIITDMLGKRREKEKSKQKSAGKICINILLEENQLAQKDKNIYLAHEVLQMRVLWQRDGVYQKFLEENSWVFKFLPNWISSIKLTKNSNLKTQNYSLNLKTFKIIFDICNLTFDIFEKIAKFFQLKYMGKPKGRERISASALYFHPEDSREKILREYNKRLKKYNIKGLPEL
ncbi:nucleotidyltransferase domain-containing protein [Candidatus Daviesbacteria bacterium]|nr:nucleotidyltransferase domain-containing protein [Candidatus Daviesbacteria bacterium]